MTKRQVQAVLQSAFKKYAAPVAAPAITPPTAPQTPTPPPTAPIQPPTTPAPSPAPVQPPPQPSPAVQTAPPVNQVQPTAPAQPQTSPPGTVSMTPPPSPSVTLNAGTSGQPTAAPPETKPAPTTAPMKSLADGSPPSRGAFLTGKAPYKLTSTDYDGYTKQLKEAQTPEAKQQVIQDMTTRIKPALEPADTAGANDVLAGKMDTPAAKQFVETKLGPTGETYKQNIVQTELANNPDKANDAGFFGQVQGMAAQAWNSIGPMGQLAMAFGVPAAMIGLMGGGGITSLLGGLGIGALGLGAAGMGMFGQGAQNSVADMAYDVGSFLGAMPGKQDLSALMAQDPQAAALAGDSSLSPAKVREQLQKAEEARSGLGKLMALPGVPPEMKARWLQRMDSSGSIKTPEDAQYALEGAGILHGAFNDPNSQLSQKIQQGKDYTDGGKTWTGRAGQAVEAVEALPEQISRGWEGVRKTLPAGTDVWNSLTSPSKWRFFGGPSGVKLQSDQSRHDYLQRYINSWATKTAFNDMDAKELSDLQAEKAKGAPYRVDDARREHALNLRRQAEGTQSRPPVVVKHKVIVMCMKSARCWAGYEPVPGKKPYTDGSCRPIRSKKKKDEPKKKK